MCGLVGFLYNKDKVDSEISSQLLSMTRSISHRGPDDDGFWIDEKSRYIKETGGIRKVCEK